MAKATEVPEEAPATDATDDALLPDDTVPGTVAEVADDFEDANRVPVENEGALSMYATLVDVAGHTGSTAAGATGSLKFQIDPTDAVDLFGAMGEQAFDVIFDQAGLGKGLTIKSVTGRPDADGAPVSSFVLIVPTTEIMNLAACFTRNLIGKHAKLVMDPSQLSFDLTAKAE